MIGGMAGGRQRARGNCVLKERDLQRLRAGNDIFLQRERVARATSRTVAVAMWLYKTQGVFASYLPLPSAIACGLIYMVLSKMAAREAAAVHA